MNHKLGIVFTALLLTLGYYVSADEPTPLSVRAAGSSDFYKQVAAGAIPGYSVVHKFGRNDKIDDGETEDIWSTGGTRAYLDTEETMDLVSTSTADDSGGTGCNAGELSGLSSTRMDQTETITLDGLTPVTSSLSYLSIYRFKCTSAGTGGVNAGIITIDPTTSGVGSRQATINPGDGQTLIGHYTVPADKSAYLHHLAATVGTSTAGVASAKEIQLRMFTRDHTLASPSWQLKADRGIRSDGGSPTPNLAPVIPVVFGPETDIRLEAISKTNNAQVFVEYTLMLVDTGIPK